MSNLILATKPEYFDAIRGGSKTEEYRFVNEYWTKLICVPADHYRAIVLTRGYPEEEDAHCIIEREWRGCTIKTINHPVFGPVEAYAIDVSLSASPIVQEE